MILAAPLSVALPDVELAPGAWRDRAIPSGRDLHTTWWFDAGHGLVAGDGGRAYVTTDAGRTWTPVGLGFRYAVEDLFFLDDETGFAIDATLGVSVTRDGGATWSRVNAGGVFGTFRDAWFTTPEKGVVGGALAILAPAIYRTTDGGATWDVAKVPDMRTDATVTGVHFVSEDVGYAVGRTYRGQGFAWKTEDGGATWDLKAFPLGTNLQDVAFHHPERGVAVGALGTVHRTLDGGASWTAAPTSTLADLRSVTALPTGAYAAFGLQGAVLTSADGGFTWTPAQIPGGPSTREGVLLADGTLVAAGKAGEVWYRPPSDTPGSLLTEIPSVASPHPPITIIGDDGFERPGSGVTRGNGTPDDPFVIEGLDIVPGLQDGITLVNTRAHVVIRDNRIHDGVQERAAVHLVDARNVRVESNVLEANARGVVAEDARDVLVARNVFERQGSSALDWTSGAGLTVVENVFRFTTGTAARVTGAPAAAVSGVTITGNTFESNGVDAHLAWTSTPVVTGNAFAFAESVGLLVDASGDALVAENAFTGAGDTDVHVRSSTGTRVTANAFSGGWVHVFLDESAGANVTRNTFVDPEARAVLAQGGRDHGVVDNTFQGSATALVFEDGARGVLVADNVIEDSWFGLFLWNAHDVLVTRNAFTPKLASVSSGSGASNLTVHANAFHGYGGSVSFGTDAAGARVTANTFTNASHAVSATAGAHDIIVEGNHFKDTRGRGITASGPVERMRIAENTFTGTNGTAIGVVNAAVDVTVTENVITGVTGEGVGVRVSGPGENVRVSRNTITGAERAGVLVAHEKYHGAPLGRIEENTLAGNARGVLFVDAPGWTVTGNDLSGTTVAGLAAEGSTGTIDARLNWWGDASGPSGLGSGSGSSVLATGGVTVRYDPWLTEAP